MNSARAQISFQCRRGLKELDLIFERYLSTSFNSASTQDLGNLQNLLLLEDNQLLDLVLSLSEKINKQDPIQYLCQHPQEW